MPTPAEASSDGFDIAGRLAGGGGRGSTTKAGWTGHLPCSTHPPDCDGRGLIGKPTLLSYAAIRQSRSKYCRQEAPPQPLSGPKSTPQSAQTQFSTEEPCFRPPHRVASLPLRSSTIVPFSANLTGSHSTAPALMHISDTQLALARATRHPGWTETRIPSHE